ncbi:RsmB/NOP family class I SAM-dependent RNA methyltransferase [Pseudooceanicola sp. C21-150M6]|uniref:RsmB/NOP family class I SAM-dependent RNA methyltransferase n=1 Tax=Pseudooceanicola sp. C21-150M6 TaxID=3434355 RepID=UPI003D7F2366
MTPEARIAAAAEILDRFLAGEAAEKALTGWARNSRFAGSKDRAAIRDHVFDAIRCRRSLAALGGAETGRGLMLGQLISQGADASAVFTGQGHAPAVLTPQESRHIAATTATDLEDLPDPVRYDMPDWLWPLWCASLGDQARPVAAELRHRAGTHLRVNLQRADRAEAQAQLSREGVETRPNPICDTALSVVSGARKVAGTESYRSGLVELQDAASQALAAAVDVPEGGRVLDYCAGGGGKSLAMAARISANYWAHDANPGRLKDVPARAARAGVTVHLTSSPQGPFDTVLCDVPCSGSGSWRRATEGKWRLTSEELGALTALQSDILDRAADLVAPGGSLAYATCSVLTAENDDQLAAFLKRRPGWTMTGTTSWLPGPDCDGFYLAQLRRPV